MRMNRSALEVWVVASLLLVAGIFTTNAAFAVTATVVQPPQKPGGGAPVVTPNPVTAAVTGGSTAFTFDASETTTTFWLDVTIPPASNVAPDKIKASLSTVRRDKVYIKAHTFVIAPKLLDTANGRTAPTLAITVNNIDKLRPGNYDLTVILEDETAGSKVVFAPLNVALTRPAVQLALPTKEVVSVELWSAWGGVKDSGPKEWTFAPTSQSVTTGLKGITVGTSHLLHDGVAVSSALFPDGNTKVSTDPPAMQKELAPADFPLGKTQGKVTVMGTALLAPQTFDVEVNTRLTSIWILLLVPIGLTAGWLVRVFLQRKIDLAQARTAAAAILAPALALRNTIADPAYGLTFKKAADALTDALVQKESGDINTELAAFNLAMSGATTALNDGLGLARTRLVALQAAAPAGLLGPLPGPMLTACQTLATQLTTVSELIKRQDAVDALQQLADAQQNFTATLATETRIAVRNIGLANGKYAELQPFLDKTTRNARANDLAWLAAASPTDLVTLPTATPDDLAAALNQWRREGINRFFNLRVLASIMTDDAQALAAAAVTAGNSDEVKAAVGRWEQIFCVVVPALYDPGLWTAPNIPIEDIETAFLAVRLTVAASLGAGGADFVAAWTSTTPLSALQALPSSVADGAAAAPAPAPQTKALQSNTVMSFFPDLTDATLTGVAPDTSQSANAPKVSEPSLDTSAGIRAFQRKTKKELWVDTRIQTISVAVVVTLAGYGIYYAAFVGTVGDVLGLMAWGFSADLSVTGLTALLSPLKPKTS